MKSPVMQALVSAELHEAEQNALATSSAVADRLGPPPDVSPAQLPEAFLLFCQRRDVRPLPARPSTLALFVLDHESLGIDTLAQMVREISQVHLRAGRANPASGYPVATALNSLVKAEVPRSWPKERKALFTTLPYDLQVYLSAHEKQREATVSRALNEASQARKELGAIQQPAKQEPDGIQSQPAAA